MASAFLSATGLQMAVPRGITLYLLKTLARQACKIPHSAAFRSPERITGSVLSRSLRLSGPTSFLSDRLKQAKKNGAEQSANMK